jgi:antitoxin (DNA-binding transcriptional repressor) of toxin-antitoxin stability system
VIRISAAKAASVPGLLDHVHVGDEVVIEHDAGPAAVVRPVAPVPFLDKTFAAIAQEAPDEGRERVTSDLAETSALVSSYARRYKSLLRRYHECRYFKLRI